MKAPSNRGFLVIGAALLCVTQFPIMVVTSSNVTPRSLVIHVTSQPLLRTAPASISSLPTPNTVTYFFRALPVREYVREARLSATEYCSGSQRTPYDNFYLQEMFLCVSPRSFEHEPVHKPPQKRWTVLIRFYIDLKALVLLRWRGSFFK